ncbi:MAG: DNA gyrase/topoisomerase IV subunit A, partial [Porphyromonadaceae bacterium]|nr:DNA gyrase/topoisomerase IV subunit A [Porphyromonadaceae bacterium]
EKGKIKIKKIDDITAAQAEILIHLQTGTSSDKAIDALYAFTDCEESLSPNCCVISDNKPLFLSVSEVLRRSTDRTVHLLQEELRIQRGELCESLLFLSLEKIFIEERIYKDKNFEESRTINDAIAHIDKRLEPFKKNFFREITKEDLLKLLEIKMARILKFNADKTDQQIANIKTDIEEIDNNLIHITDYTIRWFRHLKEKYGSAYPRRTVIRGFDSIEVTKVVEANEKLYINRSEGFIGTSLKHDEFVCNCSDIDDIIIFYKDGKYKVIKVSEKIFVGKNILYLNVFNRNDNRTIYNVIYRNGKDGLHYMKRFAVTGITRDKEYDLTQGTPNSKVIWFSANPNGEAEILKIVFKPKARLKVPFIEKDFSDIAIKGRQSMGNIVTHNEILRISLKERGGSTLGGRQVWFDYDVLRLNYDGRGEYLGEFHNGDSVLVILKSGIFYTTSFDAGNHYDADIMRIEKFVPQRCWTAILYDADQGGYPYLKRFRFEISPKKQKFLGENAASQLILLSTETYARFEVKFGGNDSFRDPLIVEAADFIAIKSFRAKGKRLTTYTIDQITELEPLYQEEPEPSTPEENEPQEPTLPDENGQKMLF